MSSRDLIRVDSLAHGGDGVGRTADGRTVFVRGACTGDLVAIRPLADKGRFLIAEIDELVEPSPNRVEAPCPYFGECGGCQWQHVAYEEQLAAKRRIVADALAHIGRLPTAEVADTIASPDQYGYRNKIELTVEHGDGPPIVGFAARHEDRVVPIDACMLLPERSAKAPRSLSGALRFLARGGPTGVTRAAYRVASATGDVEVALWSPPSGFPRQAAAKVLSDATRATSITRVLYKGPIKERAVSHVEVLSGRGYWRERLGGDEFAVSAPSFFQVNTRAAEALRRIVTEEAAPDGSDRLLDLYSGVGTFTLPLAQAAGEVVAVESAASAVRDLRRNVENAGAYADVEPGDAAHVLPALGPFDTVVADPPRAGLTPKVIAAIARTGARRIVYVSCDPATLARDVQALSGHGYALRRVTPLDLFPQTFHVEAVAVLERG